MKKTFALMIAVFAVTMVFTSCTKEGQYMPKKRVSEIVYTRSYKTISGLQLSFTERDVWNWNGKLLNYIDYYDANGNRTATTMFRYDNENRIEEIDYKDAVAKFDYDDGLIDEIKIYRNDGSLRGKYEFEHKGNRLVSITADGSKSLASLPFNPLSFFMPETAAQKVLECEATKGISRVLFTWTGNNVSALDITGDKKVSYKWSYDKMTNPFKGLVDMGDPELSLYCFSENNVVREECTEDGTTFVEDYTYTYDGKFPTKKTWKSSRLVDGVQVDCTLDLKY